MNKKRFQVEYQILGGPNATDGVKRRQVMAFSAHAVSEWVTRKADGHDYTLIRVVPIQVGVYGD